MDDSVVTEGGEAAKASNEGGNSDGSVQSAIGKQLRAYYDDVASEPIPDKFLSLLDALDAAESSSRSTEHE